MSGKSLTIDIGKTPGDSDGDEGEVKKDGGNNYHYDNDDKRVDLVIEKNLIKFPGYITLTYKPNNPETEISGITDSKFGTHFSNFPGNCKSITVYCWSGDVNYKPILLLLGSGNNYYKVSGDKSWTNADIQSGGLLNLLETEICTRGIAHDIDISQKGSYQCPGSCGKRITVINYGTDYPYSHHQLAGSSIHRFKDGDTEQTGLILTGTKSTVYVYWYPKGSEGIPLLIHYSNDWFEREFLGSNRWKPVTRYKPSGYNDESNIPKLLKAKLPIVTINVGKTGISTGGQNITYTDPSESGSKQIKVTRQDINGKYTSFVHSVKDKPFVAIYIKYGSSSLPGIPSNLILKSVTAYYSVKGDLSPDKLLLIEVEKRKGPNNYEYYSRKRKNANEWTEYPRSGTKLNDLKEVLDKLKEKHPESSNTGILAGTSVGTGLGGAGLGALAVWKGPSILARLITRL